MKTLRIVLWAAVAVVAAALGWISYQMTTGKEEIAAGPFGVPFELVSQTGQPITQAAFIGKPTALFFGFTHCPEVCPTTLFELNGWLEKGRSEGRQAAGLFRHRRSGARYARCDESVCIQRLQADRRHIRPPTRLPT
jgi:protein SCO1/2